MTEDILQKIECRSGVWPFDEVTELVEGRIPLKSLFIQEGDTSTLSSSIHYTIRMIEQIRTDRVRGARGWLFAGV
jgi:hypothetical protein